MAIAIAAKAKSKREQNLTVLTEESFFRRQLKSLLRRYPNQFVALSGGRVIGHGSDDETLAQRMFTKLGHSDFAIFLVSEKPEVQEFSGPDLAV
jgi:hypothetical protein